MKNIIPSKKDKLTLIYTKKLFKMLHRHAWCDLTWTVAALTLTEKKQEV